MKSPDLYNFPPRTREQIKASFKPCPFCERVVEREITYNVWRPFHDYEKHPGMEPRRTERMSTEDLMQLPKVDWQEVAGPDELRRGA